MKKFSINYILIPIVAIGIFAGAIWFNQIPIVPESKLVVETVQFRSESILVDWVYKRSNRISMSGCKQIVKIAMSTRKPLLVLAMIDIESNFVPTATSPKNAIGLMQVMPGVWDKELIKQGIIKNRRDLYDTEPAIKAGDYVLNYCLSQSKGDVEKALEIYLGGKDGWYCKKILANLANLYLITDNQLH